MLYLALFRLTALRQNFQYAKIILSVLELTSIEPASFILLTLCDNFDKATIRDNLVQALLLLQSHSLELSAVHSYFHQLQGHVDYPVANLSGLEVPWKRVPGKGAIERATMAAKM